YHSVVDRLTGDRLGFGYVDLGPLVDRTLKDDAQLANVLQGRGRMGYSFGFEAGPQPNAHMLGVRFEYSPDKPVPTPVRTDSDTLSAMDRLPKASMLAAAGPDLNVSTRSLGDLG